MVIARDARPRRIMNLLLAAVMVISVLGGCGVFVFAPFALFHEWRHARDKEIRILYHTDHTRVLAACRELMHHPWDADAPGPPKDNPRLPIVLRLLQPTSVSATNTAVKLQFRSASYSFHLLAFAKPGEATGELKLLPALWYTLDKQAW